MIMITGNIDLYITEIKQMLLITLKNDLTMTLSLVICKNETNVIMAIK